MWDCVNISKIEILILDVGSIHDELKRKGKGKKWGCDDSGDGFFSGKENSD